jgi:hypothetical protein
VNDWRDCSLTLDPFPAAGVGSTLQDRLVPAALLALTTREGVVAAGALALQKAGMSTAATFRLGSMRPGLYLRPHVLRSSIFMASSGHRMSLLSGSFPVRT